MSNKKITYGIGFDVDKSALQQLKSELQSLSQFKMDDLLKVNTKATKTDLDNLHKSIEIVQNALDRSYSFKLNSTNLAQFKQELNKSNLSIGTLASNLGKAGVQGQIAFRNISTELLTTNTRIKETHSLLDSMGKTLGNTIKWSIASAAINNVTGSIQKAWSFTKNLDKSLNDIRIVTEKSADDMDKFAQKANRAAKSLGTATTQYTNASLIYYQQGLNEKDVQARTQTTIKAANVTGQSAAEVSEQLTAVWNGYKVVAEEAEVYIDKLAAVAANTAADLEEISDGMSKVASAANAMGVDIDQLTAQLATIVSVTRQDASSIGTALKTIYARMGDLQVDGVDEFGTKLGDVSGKLQQMGIDILDQEGNLRDMGAVIEEVASKWKTWTDAQQQAAAVAMAGKRQYNNLIALFENWDMYESALATSKNSEGTLQKQQDIYMESIEAHLKELSTAGEKLYQALFDTESAGNLLDILTGAVELAGDFIDSIGGGGALLANLGSILTRVFNKQISNGITTFWNNFTSGIHNNQMIALELKETYELALSTAEKEIPGIQKIVEMNKEKLRYAKLLTAEERAQWDQQIKSYAQAENDLALAKEDVEAFKEKKKLLEETLKSQKIFATGKNSAGADPNKQNRAGEAYNQHDFNQKKKESNNSKFYTEGSLTNKYDFNIDTEEGREAAVYEIDKQLDEVKHQESYIPSFKDDIRNSKLKVGDSEGNQKQMNKFVTEATEYSNNIDEYTQNYQGNPEDLNALTTAQDQLVTAINNYHKALEEGTNAEDAYLKVKEKSKDVVEVHNKTITKNKQSLENTKNTLQNYSKEQNKVNASLNKAKVALDKATVSYKKFAKEMKTKAIVNNVVKITSGIMQMGAAIESVINLGDIWSDKDLSTGQKIWKTCQNLALTIPQMVGGLNAVTKGFQSMGKAQESATLISKLFSAEEQKRLLLSNENMAADIRNAAIQSGKITADQAEKASLESLVDTLDEETRAKLLVNQLTQQSAAASVANTATKPAEAAGYQAVGKAGSTAGWSIQAAFWPILIIGLALMAVIATIAVLFKIFGDRETDVEKAQKALDRAKESAEAAKEKLKELRTEYNQFLNDITKYKEARSALDELREGTEEWKLAVEELNFQVVDLLGKYPELANFLTTTNLNGTTVYGIKQEGITEWIDLQKDKILQQNKRVFATQAAIPKAVINLAKEEAKSANNELVDYIKEQDNSTALAVGMSGGMVAHEGELTAYKTLGISKDDLKDITFLSDETIKTLKEALQNIDVSEEQKDLIKEILEEQEELKTTIHNNTEALNIATRAYLGMKSEEKGYDTDVYTDLVEGAKSEYEAKSPENEFKSIEEFYTELDFIDNSSYVGGENIGETYNYKQDREAGASEFKEQSDKAFGEGNWSSNVNAEWFRGKETANLEDATLIFNGETITFREWGMLIAQKLHEKQFDDLTNKETSYGNYEADLDSLIKKGYDQNAVRFMNGRNMNDEWEGATAAQYNKLLNYEDLGGEYIDQVNNAKDTFLGRISQKYDLLGYASSSKRFENFTEEDFKNFNSNISKMQAGGFSQDAIQELLTEIGNDPEINKAVNDAMSKVTNWNDPTQVNEFRASLVDLGIDITNIGEQWDGVISEITSGWKQWISNSEKIIKNLETINKIAKELSAGDIISKEDFQELVKIAPEVKNLFVATAEGMKLLVSGKELNRILKQQYQNLAEVKKYYNEIEDIVNNNRLQDTADSSFDRKEFENLDKDVISNFFTKDGIKELASALGISEEAINNNLNILKNNADDSTEYINAAGVLGGFAESINQIILDVQNGNISTDGAYEYWGTSVANSWSEVQANSDSDQYSADSRLKVEQAWKADYLSELGLSEIETNLSAEQLETMITNTRELELDYYSEIEKSIHLIGLEADKAFGIEKIESLKEIAELSKEKADIASGKSVLAKQNFETYLNNIADPELKKAITDNNGNFDLNKFNNYLATVDPAGKDGGFYSTLETILSMWEKIGETAADATDAAYAVIDAQVEAFRKEQDMIREIFEVKKEWAQFRQDWSKWLNQDSSSFLSMFNSYSATDIINNSFNTIFENMVGPALPRLTEWGSFQLEGITDFSTREAWDTLFNTEGQHLDTTISGNRSLLSLIGIDPETYDNADEETQRQYETDIANKLYNKDGNLRTAADIGRNLVGGSLSVFDEQTAADKINNAFKNYEISADQFNEFYSNNLFTKTAEPILNRLNDWTELGLAGNYSDFSTKAAWDALFDTEGQYLDMNSEENKKMVGLIGIDPETYQNADAETQRQYEEQIANILYDEDGNLKDAIDIGQSFYNKNTLNNLKDLSEGNISEYEIAIRDNKKAEDLANRYNAQVNSLNQVNWEKRDKIAENEDIINNGMTKAEAEAIVNRSSPTFTADTNRYLEYRDWFESDYVQSVFNRTNSIMPIPDADLGVYGTLYEMLNTDAIQWEGKETTLKYLLGASQGEADNPLYREIVKTNVEKIVRNVSDLYKRVDDINEKDALEKDQAAERIEEIKKAEEENLRLESEIENSFKNNEVLNQTLAELRALNYDFIENEDGTISVIQKNTEDFKQFIESQKAQFEGSPIIHVDDSGKIYVDDEAFKESWETNLEDLKTSLEEMQASLQEAYEGYLQAQEELMTLYDTEIEKLSSINDVLTKSADLWSLIGKNAKNSSIDIQGYYNKITENSKTSLSYSRIQLAVAQSEYDKVLNLGDDASEEMKQTTLENLQNATNAVLDNASQYMESLSNEFREGLKKTIDDFVSASSGLDLEAISEEWQLTVAKDERYIDAVNEQYALSQLDRKYQKSIDETDSITAQNKLTEARIKMEEKLTKIKEDQDKLTQADLDRANAEYELTLKQIALEEAQQTANKMKLTRDAMGNYTYQYVADEDAIAKAEEELAAAENNLYNMEKDRTKTLVNEYYQTMTDANTQISEAVAAGDHERAERLRKYYEELLSGIQSELKTSSNTFDEIGANIGNWQAPFADFTNAIETMNISNLFGEEGQINEMLDLLFDEDGTMTLLQNTVKGMLSEDGALYNATNSLQNAVLDTGTLVTKSAELVGAAQQVIDKLPPLVANTQVLANKLDEYSKEYQDWINANTEQALTQEQAIVEVTDAIKAQTIATLQLIDSMDGLDGKIENVKISVDGYDYSDETGWYAINANKDNE